MTPSSQAADFLIKWTPRSLAVAVGGYYGLGIAYEMGLMALIDRMMIQALKHLFGYAGIGAIMPSAQWYAAWGARLVIGLGAGVLYDLGEKCARFCWGKNQRDSLKAAPVLEFT